MRIRIYNEPAGSTLGGTELCVAWLAESLSSGSFGIEIVHHKPGLSRDALSAFSGSDLSRVTLTYHEVQPDPFGDSSLPWRRYAHACQWHAHLSRGCDLFVTFTHGLPPFCHATHGVLGVLFPLFVAPHRAGSLVGTPRSLASAAYGAWEWRRRLATYATVFSNSEYTRDWTRRRWGIDSTVVHPPIGVTFHERAKQPAILSVGRFAGRQSKKQLEMVKAFHSLASSLPDWRYTCVGSVGLAPEDREYLDRVRLLADGSRIDVIANASRQVITTAYEEAAIFWHAMGLGEDDERHPERSEHFGMATAEAMAAGCVPIVIRKGGQIEIVEHGVSGFLWDTIDELIDYTRLVALDPSLRQRLSDAARARARAFTRSTFEQGMLNLFRPYLGENGEATLRRHTTDEAEQPAAGALR